MLDSYPLIPNIPRTMDLQEKLELVKKEFNYNPDTGEFICINPKRKFFDKDGKRMKAHGFFVLKLNGSNRRVEVYAHIFAYWLHKGLPKRSLTFYDGNKENLKLENIVLSEERNKEKRFSSIEVATDQLEKAKEALINLGIEIRSNSKPKPLIVATEYTGSFEPLQCDLEYSVPL